MSAIVVVLLIILLIGVIPAWPYSRTWGYFPRVTVGVLLIIAIVLLLMGRI